LTLRFQKWQALGNDYVIVEQDELPFELSAARVRLICASHLGCHADGVLLLDRPRSKGAVASMRIFNPDGSEAEISGNGARQAILYVHREGWTTRKTFSIETAAGEVTPTIIDARTCAVEMGRARLQSPDFPSGPPDGRGMIAVGERELAFQHVNIGNPQCVIEIGDELDGLDLSKLGPAIERSELFPRRTNVAFIDIEGTDRVRARIFERGAGETLSSGTGACAAAVTATLRGSASPVTVSLEGGELEVAVGPELDVTLTGWAEPVFEGRFSDEFVAALAEAR
jgi:diaminopimelate epimerase